MNEEVSLSNGSQQVTSTCATGYVATGGACFATDVGGQYTVTSGLKDGNGWTCYANDAQLLKTTARCCRLENPGS